MFLMVIDPPLKSSSENQETRVFFRALDMRGGGSGADAPACPSVSLPTSLPIKSWIWLTCNMLIHSLWVLIGRRSLWSLDLNSQTLIVLASVTARGGISAGEPLRWKPLCHPLPSCLGHTRVLVGASSAI